jgi:hypothetical protein
MLESVPVAPIVTVAGFAVAAFVTVTLSTADAVAEEMRNGLPLPSRIDVTCGVVSDGLVPKTFSPVPVEVVKALRRFALEGVARNVATPVASPLTPVLIGSPVAFVRVTLVGVPNTPPFGIVTVPVNVGLAIGASVLSAGVSV